MLTKMAKIKTNFFQLSGAELNSKGRIVNLRYSSDENLVNKESVEFIKNEFDRSPNEMNFIELSQFSYNKEGKMFKKSIKIPRNIMTTFECMENESKKINNKNLNKMDNNMFCKVNFPSVNNTATESQDFRFLQNEDDFQSLREFTNLVHKVNRTESTRRVKMLESEANSENEDFNNGLIDGQNDSTRIHFKSNNSSKGTSPISKVNVCSPEAAAILKRKNIPNRETRTKDVGHHLLRTIDHQFR